MQHKFLAAAIVAAACSAAANAASAQTGSIVGHIKLKGPGMANPMIRMGADPMCGKLNAGNRPRQEIVLLGPNSTLVNAFVYVTGNVSAATGGGQPVVLTQKNCLYQPRVVGVRAGQPVSIRNDDTLMHNVHGLSTKGQEFNTSQPKAGMVYMATLKKEEVMVHVKCDVHAWMNAYIGVVSNPFFAVTDKDGAFTIANVPAGRRTVSVWHERYGMLSGTVDVKAGQQASLELTYDAAAAPKATAMRELVVPDTATEILIQASASE